MLDAAQNPPLNILILISSMENINFLSTDPNLQEFVFSISIAAQIHNYKKVFDHEEVHKLASQKPKHQFWVHKYF